MQAAREEMMALTDNRLEITTKRTILENEQMSGELQYQSRQVGAHCWGGWAAGVPLVSGRRERSPSTVAQCCTCANPFWPVDGRAARRIPFHQAPTMHQLMLPRLHA